MKVRALRGVCVGVNRHLVAGDVDDLDAAQVQFLVSIGAVERLPDAPPPPVVEAPAVEPEVQAEPAPYQPATPGKSGKKEK